MIEYDGMDGRDRSVLVEQCEGAVRLAAEALAQSAMVEAMAKGGTASQSRLTFTLQDTVCDEWECSVELSVENVGAPSRPLNHEP